MTQLTVPNHDAETGDTTGWTVLSGSLSATTDNPYEGTYRFETGGSGPESESTNFISVPAGLETDIDAGNVAFVMTWLQGNEGFRKTGGMKIRFYDGTDTFISEVVSAQEQVPSGTFRDLSDLVPANTRSVKLRMYGDSEVGFDDIFLEMVTSQVRVTSSDLQVMASGGGQNQVTQAATFALYNFPTPQLRVTAAEIKYAVTADLNVEVTQAAALVAVKGRVENRRLRAWGFTLDGHDFYVLRLGEDETLIYDLTTDQWYPWNDGDNPFWRAHLGTTWVGMGKHFYDEGHETNIVAGDDAFGILWSLDPERGYDENPRDGSEQAFDRIVTGYIEMRSRKTLRCNQVYARISLGNPAITGASVKLRTSDDHGQTWMDHGSITLQSGDYTQEFAWRSLGLIQDPGRLFELSDDGTSRVDGLDME